MMKNTKTKFLNLQNALSISQKIFMLMAMVVLMTVSVSAFTYNSGETRIGAFYSVPLNPMAHYVYPSVPLLGGRFSQASIINARSPALVSYPRTYYPHISRPYSGFPSGYYGTYASLVRSSGQTGFRGTVGGWERPFPTLRNGWEPYN